MRVTDRRGRASDGRIIGRTTAAALAVLALAACSTQEEAPDNAAAPGQAETSSLPETNAGGTAYPPAATGPAPAAEPAGNATEPRPAASPDKAAAPTAKADGAAPPADGPCERLTAADAAKAPGLKAAGTTGSYRFFAQPRQLLCSEPGVGGVGECEIVGSAVIRVEHKSGSYGLKSRAGTPALLRYGPNGISCVSPR